MYHSDGVYVWARFGLVQAGAVEERPGIPPSPGHLTRLIRLMREEGVTVAVVEPLGDKKLTARVAEEAGVRMVVLNAKLGAVSDPSARIASAADSITALVEAPGSA